MWDLAARFSILSWFLFFGVLVVSCLICVCICRFASSVQGPVPNVIEMLRLVVEYEQLARPRRAFYSILLPLFFFPFRFSPFLPSLQLALVCVFCLLL
jgi:hypothetical protein